MSEQNLKQINFEGVTPILPVKSLAASVEYYTAILGFELDWQNPEIMASVSRGQCHIFLSEGDQGHPGTWVWAGVSEADALYTEYRAKGARIRNSPTNYPWAYEMQVEDLDGNILRFGSDTKTDQAIGEWLDMRGNRWTMLAPDVWKRL